MKKYRPTLREIVGGTWKKKTELKDLKSEVAALERKIQLTLAPPEQAKEDAEQKQETVAPTNDDKGFIKEHIIIARPKPLTTDTSKWYKI